MHKHGIVLSKDDIVLSKYDIVMSKDDIVLSKDGFGACHPLCQGSMGSSKRSRCSYKSAD